MTPHDVIEADYLVVGAGASAMAFVDTLVDHRGATVVLVDRQDAPGGHWLQAYPFVQLHQAACFYGVASEVLGGGELQTEGPEAGLQVRSTAADITDYYARVLRRLEGTGRVRFLGGHEVIGGAAGEGGDLRVRRLEDDAELRVAPGARVVDARYVAPRIPSQVPPPFEVGAGARLVAVNDLPDAGPARRHVVVGSGKTATDACVWLLRHGVDPDAITWVRPREPWMLDRARIQPVPEVYQGMFAEIVEGAASAATLDDLLRHLEDAGVMLRLDPTRRPTMAKAPTLGRWELELLRSITDVVRLGHVRRVEDGRLLCDDGTVEIGPDALVVHCAADGLRNPPLLPVWSPERITLQPVRAGFPCFGAALVGYVEATRDDDATRNALCHPVPFGDRLEDWADMNARGLRSAAAWGAETDIRAWASGVAINPGRVPEADRTPALEDALTRIARHRDVAVERLAGWASV
ncbi:NAD(P)-binding protein [Nocardioides sp. TRM66260-LWL]|uniref:NAD(P)-binding protein n=1 Tax=Nocardioides sp. TRM66260-LWL TaxID=2874478 RepID=UPI001CC36958|nr:NAD(P)-binding protein [Nocardioides sp. TRM66260-LWL]MBZ5734485.1 NAD(P)-binding protein [Nocardioides sp. TRM66260-LWL]